MKLRLGCIVCASAGPSAGSVNSVRGTIDAFIDAMKTIPTIAKYMSTSPHSVGPDQPLTVVHKMMRDHEIRHLPVLQGGKLVGMLTHRDLAIVETLRDVNPKSTKVEDAMSTAVYAVSPDAPLDEVCDEMATHKYGSCVVLQNSHVVGIFTTVDVCRAMHALLHGRLAN